MTFCDAKFLAIVLETDLSLCFSGFDSSQGNFRFPFERMTKGRRARNPTGDSFVTVTPKGRTQLLNAATNTAVMQVLTLNVSL